MVSNQYETLMRYVYEHGVDKADRTGTGIRSSRRRSSIFARSFTNSSGS